MSWILYLVPLALVQMATRSRVTPGSEQGLAPIVEPKVFMDGSHGGRALQDPAFEAWAGRDENPKVAERAPYRRARCNSAACVGKMTDEMASASAGTNDPPHGADWNDD
jgi:fructose-bisphosphate aldolase class 1